MYRTFTAVMALGLATLSGCNRGSPGGPGTTQPDSEKHFYDVGRADNTFTLDVPSSLPLMSTGMKQGETAKVTIGVKRGKGFDQDVTVRLEGLPTGVTVENDSAEVKRGQESADLTLKASDAAALGEFEIKVVGHPTSGGDATNKFKLKVNKKETFAISVPNSSTTIKQGETRAVSININREKGFDEDVTLKFADLPKGVTIEPAGPVIKHGESEAKFMLKSEEDAALGDFAIKVTGHPTRGADAAEAFKITVAKK